MLFTLAGYLYKFRKFSSFQGKSLHTLDKAQWLIMGKSLCADVEARLRRIYRDDGKPSQKIKSFDDSRLRFRVLVFILQNLGGVPCSTDEQTFTNITL